MLRLFFSLVILLFSFSSFSQTKIKIDSNKRIYLEYTSKSWNKNPNNVDSGALILRDGISKKIARIELFETDMDSSTFRGQYLLNWGDNEIIPEVYLVSTGLGKTTEQMTKIQNSIEDGSLLRKPFFVRSNNRNFQTLTVFDSKEQALKAYEAYMKLYANKNVSNSEPLQEQADLAKQAELDAQVKMRTKQEEELRASQKSIEEAEAQKRKELQALQDKMDAAEKARKQKEALAAANKGLDYYNQKNYMESERSFAKAIELDPSNTNFYYQYAVALYNNSQTEKSIAILNLAKDGNINEVERRYYLGLNYIKLQELDQAKENFTVVKNSKDKTLGPAAAFYLGVIQYQKENYEPSKNEFEYVLDNSTDPNMDKQAEAYLEQIANAIAFKKEQDKKFLATLNLGLMYDSNILSTQNSIAGNGSPTDLAGYRWSYGGTLEYRPVYNAKREFSATLYASDMYSTDNKFAAKKTFQDTDPLTVGLSFPFKFKETAFDKPYQGSITPGYETIMMNADSSGSRETIVNSLFLKTEHTFVASDSLYSTYLGEVRQDTSKLTSTDDDDQTAMKYTLGTVQTKFQDSKKTKALIGDLSLSQNEAKGVNSKFFRYDLGIAYMTPWISNTIVTGKLAYYDANYSKHIVGRQDRNTTVILGLTKPLSATFSSSLTGVYTINQSTLESSDYKKYMIMTNLSWSTSL